MKRVRRDRARRQAQRTLLLTAAVVAVGLIVHPGFLPRRAAAEELPEWSRALLSFEAMPAFLFRGDAEKPRRIRIFGEELFLRIERVEATPPEVVSFYRDRYSKSVEWLRALTGGAAKLERELSRANDEQGIFAVLEPVAENLDPLELAERVRAFSATGKLSHLFIGRVVLVYAEPDGRRSTALSIWTGPDLNLKNLEESRSKPPLDFPAPRDAELLVDAEFPDEPRPARLVVLRGREAVDESWEEYAAAAAEQGWEPADVTAVDGEKVGHFRREDEELTVHVRRDEQKNQVYVAVSLEGIVR